jgi:hypothetical protein
VGFGGEIVTHKYISDEEHRKFCPRLSKTGSTMTCEDCLVGGLVPSDEHKGYYKYKCNLEKIHKIISTVWKF